MFNLKNSTEIKRILKTYPCGAKPTGPSYAMNQRYFWKNLPQIIAVVLSQNKTVKLALKDDDGKRVVQKNKPEQTKRRSNVKAYLEYMLGQIKELPEHFKTIDENGHIKIAEKKIARYDALVNW